MTIVNMIILQIDGGILESVNNLYSLIGLVILSIVYIVSMIYNKKQDKKQTNEIIDTFEKQNDNIIKKIEELREDKNILDAQASMDIINVVITKSMLETMREIKKLLDNDLLENRTLYIPKKSLVIEKVKNIIDSELKDNIILLSRIYNNNIKLSHYISEIDTNDLIVEIAHKLQTLTDSNIPDKDDLVDIIANKHHLYKNLVEYIEYRFSEIIRTIELQLSK